MAYRILILDDDQEFNSLLTDVFDQADYEVLSAEAAEQALQICEEERLDLIVADQRLPRISGMDFVRQVRKNDRRIPILMVSGYLDNDTIRDLIREGVNGIFIKPLNIFSLLKKTTELIESYYLHASKSQEGTEESKGNGSRKTIPGHSERGKAFIQSMEQMADFNRSLLLIAPEGMPSESLCEDIVASNHKADNLICLKPGEFDVASLRQRLSKIAETGVERITLGIVHAESLQSEERELISGILESGNLDGAAPETPVRVIFCLSKSIEDLYDEGVIDEEFYMLLGTSELHVPRLSEMPDDLVAITERELKSISTDWRIDSLTRKFLLKQPWEGNIEELRSAVLSAVSYASPEPPQCSHFESVLKGSGEKKIESKQTRSELFDYLNNKAAAFRNALSGFKTVS